MPTTAQLANIVISGTLTGTVYGLMALGLSAIFGVIRLVNFAHGELMTLAMYAAVVAFQGLALDPFVTMVGAAAAFAGIGYVIQRAFINRFSSSRAVAIMGPCCCSRMMLVVNALITPSLRVRVLESSKTTINKLSPSTMSDIKARPTGIRSVKTLQGKCNITRLILSNHDPISHRAQRQRTRWIAANMATSRYPTSSGTRIKSSSG